MPNDHDHKSAIRGAALRLVKTTTLSSQEEEAMEKKIAGENSIGKKPALNQKKTCICAPTNHEGSFRCNLHRARNEAQKNKSNVNVVKILEHDCKDGKQSRLSRFSKDASARACGENLPLTMGEQVK